MDGSANVSTTHHVLGDVAAERRRQDEQWGGPDHDDGHTLHEWRNLLMLHVDRLANSDGPAPDYRDRLVKIAALAVAAVQSWDRHHGRPRGAVMTSHFLAIPQDPTADHFRSAANLIAERSRECSEAYGLGLIAGALIQAYEIGLISHSPIAIPARKSNLLHCSYCSLSQYEVEMLIAGPGMIFICPECAELVIAAMAKWRRDNGKASGPVMVPVATAAEVLSLLREFRADWSATATPAEIEQAYGKPEAEMCARVDAAISALAPVVAEGGAP